MAKTSLLILGTTRIPGLGKGTIIGMNITIYVILTLIPVWLLVTAQNFSMPYLLALAGLIAVSAISLVAKVFYRSKKPKPTVK
jgi:hypothetical protein